MIRKLLFYLNNILKLEILKKTPKIYSSFPQVEARVRIV